MGHYGTSKYIVTEWALLNLFDDIKSIIEEEWVTHREVGGSYLFNLRHNNNNNNNEIILDTPQNTRKVFWHLHSFFLYHRPISAGEFPVHPHLPPAEPNEMSPRSRR